MAGHLPAQGTAVLQARHAHSSRGEVRQFGRKPEQSLQPSAPGGVGRADDRRDVHRLPRLHERHRRPDEEERGGEMIDEPLPLSFDPVSNGEYLPPPKTEREILAEKLIRWVADRNARRTGVSRRAFLTGACG